MSINSINQAPGFNQAQYDHLIERAKSEKVDAGLVDSLLLEAVKSGKDFTQALKLVRQDLPKLPNPTGAALAQLKLWPGLPSPGALIMCVTTQYAAEQRRQNQEITWAQTEAIAASMHSEADKMREAAVTQLVLGVVSGAISIGMGIVQIGMSGAAASKAAKAADAAADEATLQGGIKAANKAINAGQTGADVSKAFLQGADAAADAADAAGKAAHQASMTASNTFMGAVTQFGGSVTGMIGSAGQFISAEAQAACKEMQADQEKMRAVRDSIKDFNEALRELIQKALAAQNAVQESTNQTRSRILG